MPPTIYTCTWIWSDSDANLHFNFSWPCSSNSKPPYIPLRPVHPGIVKEVLQDIAYACRIMLHQHKAAQLKRVAGATKNYVQLHGPWLSFQARHASNCISVFPSHWHDWDLCLDDVSPTFTNPGNSRKRKWIRHLRRPGSPALPQPLAQKSKAAWMSLEVSKSPVQQVQRRFQQTHKPPIFIEVWLYILCRSNMTYHWSAASKHDWKAMTMRWGDFKAVARPLDIHAHSWCCWRSYPYDPSGWCAKVAEATFKEAAGDTQRC